MSIITFFDYFNYFLTEDMYKDKENKLIQLNIYFNKQQRTFIIEINSIIKHYEKNDGGANTLRVS